MTSQTRAVLGSELERTNARSRATFAWGWMLVMPLVAFGVVVGTLRPSAAGGVSALGLGLLVLSLLWLVLGVPAAIVLRSHCFRAAWRGKPVDAVSYTRGLLTVWVALELVAILSLASCVASEALLPGVLPGALAVLLLGFARPSARAMGLGAEA